mmetsp:Transcript_19287/g.42020  ORF Transcript_19287/g.42020 Transcript_19287/m.42020 type:complete len:392 (-) Transcript_19287:157-1332(-)|eukprot:CAMPEP_0170600076 /NCGR_PEP_ID=MMETSP0224-20130122/17144_1 /TAXON_ID=285029 /ORGANISM="Togula jolla, Strain CCCM 725" /LENGTH=391 /DNA_ID=CAMNT_0010924783 /DNA_START=72 /DNA_END=1247 /DNA_ORIENTATION=-
MAFVRAASIVAATLMVVSSGVSESKSSLPSSFIEENCPPELMLLQAEAGLLQASKPSLHHRHHHVHHHAHHHVHRVPEASASGLLEPRTSHPAELVAFRASFGAGQTQAPDISALLADMNATIAKVYDMVAQANSTAMDQLNSLLSTADSFTTSLGAVQSTAEAMKIVLGQETVDQVVALVQQLTDVLDPLTAKIASYSDKIQTILQDVLAKYDAEKDKVYDMFLKAVEKVNALGGNGTSLLQQGATFGLPNWLKNMFGMGASTPCDQAKAAIKQANGTVTEVNDMLVKLNDTMISDVLDQSVVVATDALAQAKTSFDDAVVKYGDQLPATILDKVKQSAASVFGMADKIQAAVDAQKGTVTAMIAEAQTQATTVYDASQSLADTVNSTCV